MTQIVNKNENHFMSWSGMVAQDACADYAQHIPAANAMIEKYCKQWWKNHPGEWDYQFLQFKLCLELDKLARKEYDFHTREHVIHYCAQHLEVSELLLHNDPDLMF